MLTSDSNPSGFRIFCGQKTVPSGCDSKQEAAFGHLILIILAPFCWRNLFTPMVMSVHCQRLLFVCMFCYIRLYLLPLNLTRTEPSISVYIRMKWCDDDGSPGRFGWRYTLEWPAEGHCVYVGSCLFREDEKSSDREGSASSSKRLERTTRDIMILP